MWLPIISNNRAVTYLQIFLLQMMLQLTYSASYVYSYLQGKIYSVLQVTLS